MKKKVRYSAIEKTMILREYLENNIAISELSEKYNVHVNAIYKWKKQMFEGASLSLSQTSKSADREERASRKRIRELEEMLSKRESLIAELVEDNISLKKKSSGKI